MSELAEVPFSDLHIAGDNVRADIGDITGLASSIRTVGLLEPLVVETRDEGGYTVTAGHRRHAALKANKTKKGELVKVHVMDTPDQGSRTVAMLAENLQREDLTPVDEARAMGRLRDLRVTNKVIAQMVGLHPNTVTGRVRLLKLPENVLDLIASGEVTIETADKLATLTKWVEDPTSLEALARSGEHTVQRSLEDHRAKDRVSRAVAKAEAAGLTVYECEWWNLDKRAPDGMRPEIGEHGLKVADLARIREHNDCVAIAENWSGVAMSAFSWVPAADKPARRKGSYELYEDAKADHDNQVAEWLTAHTADVDAKTVAVMALDLVLIELFHGWQGRDLLKSLNVRTLKTDGQEDIPASIDAHIDGDARTKLRLIYAGILTSRFKTAHNSGPETDGLRALVDDHLKDLDDAPQPFPQYQEWKDGSTE